MFLVMNYNLSHNVLYFFLEGKIKGERIIHFLYKRLQIVIKLFLLLKKIKEKINFIIEQPTLINTKTRTKVVQKNVSQGYNKVKLHIMKILHYEYVSS